MPSPAAVLIVAIVGILAIGAMWLMCERTDYPAGVLPGPWRNIRNRANEIIGKAANNAPDHPGRFRFYLVQHFN